MTPHFPLFADLRGRAVLLVGAGHVAARKAEALLHAGARLRVVARDLSAPFQDWLAAGQMEHIGADFAPAQLDGVFLAVAATDDHALNTQVFQAAEAAGKLCNVVDSPALCSYIVPAVIDRAPLQIAISSAGTAPVLARHWRQRIETLIPAHTGKLAEIAGRCRALVKRKLPASARRAFWEKLFASRFDTLVAQQRYDAAERELAAQLDSFIPARGEVVLAGAGPGDAGLLTLHTLQAIQAADIVFYDALVSDDIRRLIRKDAEQVCVGKRAGAHQVAQAETNALLVRHAALGKRVVRLKGGDPFVFARGGEEAATLQAAGIPFRVIPGITAALGATAYAGIPLTHRDHAQSALFITGHCRDGARMDWATLARAQQTLVIYMGTLQAAEISTELVRHGRAASTPVAVISNGTLPSQTVQTGVLRDLPSLTAHAPRPALIVIGEVVHLREQLAWFGEALSDIAA